MDVTVPLYLVTMATLVPGIHVVCILVALISFLIVMMVWVPLLS
jgi:hypothetical protein